MKPLSSAAPLPPRSTRGSPRSLKDSVRACERHLPEKDSIGIYVYPRLWGNVLPTKRKGNPSSESTSARTKEIILTWIFLILTPLLCYRYPALALRYELNALLLSSYYFPLAAPKRDIICGSSNLPAIGAPSSCRDRPRTVPSSSPISTTQALPRLLLSVYKAIPPDNLR